MSFDAVIFDCDGTLVDSEGLAVEVLVELLAEQGRQFGFDKIMARFHGRRLASFIEDMHDDFPGLDAEALTAGFRSRTPEVFRERLRMMPGALELVAGLQIDKCVASNGPRDKIETSLGVTGLLPHFRDRIVSAYEVGAWKPDPALIHAATSLMGVAPARCLLVEDSVAGVRAGLAAGVEVVAFRMGSALLGELAREVTEVDHLAQLPELLRR